MLTLHNNNKRECTRYVRLKKTETGFILITFKYMCVLLTIAPY